MWKSLRVYSGINTTTTESQTVKKHNGEDTDKHFFKIIIRWLLFQKSRPHPFSSASLFNFTVLISTRIRTQNIQRPLYPSLLYYTLLCTVYAITVVHWRTISYYSIVLQGYRGSWHAEVRWETVLYIYTRVRLPLRVEERGGESRSWRDRYTRVVAVCAWVATIEQRNGVVDMYTYTK